MHLFEEPDIGPPQPLLSCHPQVENNLQHAISKPALPLSWGSEALSGNNTLTLVFLLRSVLDILGVQASLTRHVSQDLGQSETVAFVLHSPGEGIEPMTLSMLVERPLSKSTNLLPYFFFLRQSLQNNFNHLKLYNACPVLRSLEARQFLYPLPLSDLTFLVLGPIQSLLNVRLLVFGPLPQFLQSVPHVLA